MPAQPYDDPSDHSRLEKGGLGPLSPCSDLSPLVRKISEAEAFLRERAPYFLSDPEFKRLLEGFLTCHQSVQEAFQRTGAFGYCRDCGEGPKGGCCLKEASFWYDTHALAVNILLGIRMDLNNSPDRCAFLGKGGCILLYRDEFCVNFFCGPLTEFLGKDTVDSLRALAGRQLWAGHRLEEYLRKKGLGPV